MNEFDKMLIRAINRTQKICVTDLSGNIYCLKGVVTNSEFLYGALIELNGNKFNDLPIVIENSNIKELELIFNGV